MSQSTPRNPPIEIEKKFRIVNGDIANITKNFVYDCETHVLDQYFDTIDGLYYQRGIFIRLRNNSSLDIKFNPDHLNKNALHTTGEHVFCHEYNFSVPFTDTSKEILQILEKYIGMNQPTPHTLEQFLEVNQLVPLVRLDKKRTSYVTDELLLAIDQFEEFGTFIEFEAKKDYEIQDFLALIERITKNMSLEPFNSGYVELALRETNEALYKKGKYLLSSKDPVTAGVEACRP